MSVDLSQFLRGLNWRGKNERKWRQFYQIFGISNSEFFRKFLNQRFFLLFGRNVIKFSAQSFQLLQK